MKKLLDVRIIEQIKKYVIINGDDFNGGRCMTVDIDDYNSTICVNDEVGAIAICDVNGEKDNEVIAEIVLERLLEKSANKIYTEKEENEIVYYVDNVEKVKSLCDYNCTSCWKNI